jgi:hypothetical protein
VADQQKRGYGFPVVGVVLLAGSHFGSQFGCAKRK